MQHSGFSVLESPPFVPTSRKFVHSHPPGKIPATKPLSPRFACLSCNIFILIAYSLYTQGMLILVLSMFNVNRIMLLALKKCLNGQNHSPRNFHQMKKSLASHQNLPFLPLIGEISPLTPLILFGKHWDVSPFHHVV